MSHLRPIISTIFLVMTMGCAQQPMVHHVDSIVNDDETKALKLGRLCRPDLHTDMRTREIIQDEVSYRQLIANSLRVDNAYSDEYLGFVIEKKTNTIFFVFDDTFTHIEEVQSRYQPIKNYNLISIYACWNKTKRDTEKASTTAFLQNLTPELLPAAQSVGYSQAFDGFVFHIRSKHIHTQTLQKKIQSEFGDSVLIKFDDANRVNL